MKIDMAAEVLAKEFYTGIEWYAYHLARHLKERHLPDLTLIAPKSLPKSLFPGHASVVRHTPGMIFGSGVLSAALFPPRGLDEFDLIHCPTVTAPFFFRPGPKVVMTVHDLTPILFPHLQTRRSALYYKYFLKHRLRFVDRFIAPSRSTKRDLVNLFKIPQDKIEVVYSGVTGRYRPSADRRKDFLLAVGTLEPRKNLRLLIRAYVDLRREGKIHHSLVLVGRKGWSHEDILAVGTGHAMYCRYGWAVWYCTRAILCLSARHSAFP